MLCSWHELCNPELFWKDARKVWEVVSRKTEVKCQTRANQRRCKKFYKVLVTIFSLLLLPVFKSEIHVNPKTPRSLLHIHAPIFGGSPAIQSTNHSSILPEHLLWIRSFLPCWVSMGHRLGNFRKPVTPNQPRNSLNNWVGDQEIHGRWSKPDFFCFNKKWAVKGTSPEQITEHIFSGIFSNMILIIYVCFPPWSFWHVSQWHTAHRGGGLEEGPPHIIRRWWPIVPTDLRSKKRFFPPKKMNPSKFHADLYYWLKLIKAIVESAI